MTREDIFFNNKIKQIFKNKKDILDIGGGLRVLKEKGSKQCPKRQWIRKYMNGVNYKVLDPVPDYNPDIIGDIHNLPLKDGSMDAIICIAVLEHIENPFKAFEEMYRVLKKDGYCFIYVPFIYRYHALPGYYGDFWRYTEDSIRLLSKNFSSIEIQNVRGRFETLIKLTPFEKNRFINKFVRMLDKFFKKQTTKQTSGYNIFLIK